MHDPDHGHIMQFDEGTGLFVPVIPSSSSSDFKVTDFDFKSQVALGMDMKLSSIPSSRMDLVDQLGSALNTLQVEEFKQSEINDAAAIVEPPKSDENG